jgi:uncharacterized damage-inducible protein DinB
MSLQSLFQTTVVAKLRHQTKRISTCLDKLNDDQIWARGHQTENAIGNLMLHLSGNVRQWIISGVGGQPDIRVREREFSTQSGVPRSELLALLNGTVEEACSVISGLTEEQLTQTRVIQGLSVSGLEAIVHVVTHFGEHTGQIIFATKNLTGEDLGLWAPKSAGSVPTSA